LNFRSPEEIAKRCCVLSAFVAGIGCNCPMKVINNWLKDNNLIDSTSPEEAELFKKKQSLFSSFKISQQDIANAQWRVEAIFALAWTIGIVENINPLKHVPDDLVYKVSSPPPKNEGLAKKHKVSVSDFIKNAKLRDKEEIMTQTDLIYRLHWATRDAMLNNSKNPVKLKDSNSIYHERHHAFNWVIGLDEWDDVTTDT
jgi:hypothetical protein